MPAYLPLHEKGRAITMTTAAAVTGGQMLAVTSAGLVDVASATSTAWLGIAAFDAASGTEVTVLSSGVQRPTASGSITAGTRVKCAASGRVATFAVGTDPEGAAVGLALTSATDGNPVTVKFDH